MLSLWKEEGGKMKNELCNGCDKRLHDKCTAYNQAGVNLHNSRGYCVVGRKYSADYLARNKVITFNQKVRVGQQKQSKKGG